MPAPVNTIPPAVTGLPAVGKTASCTTGSWTGDVSSGYAYQWQRAGSNIGAATAATYVYVNADRKSTVTCIVTATGTGGSTPATSNTVGPVGTSTGTLAGKLTWQGEIIVEYAWYVLEINPGVSQPSPAPLLRPRTLVATGR